MLVGFIISLVIFKLLQVPPLQDTCGALAIDVIGIKTSMASTKKIVVRFVIFIFDNLGYILLEVRLRKFILLLAIHNITGLFISWLMS